MNALSKLPVTSTEFLSKLQCRWTQKRGHHRGQTLPSLVYFFKRLFPDFLIFFKNCEIVFLLLLKSEIYILVGASLSKVSPEDVHFLTLRSEGEVGELAPAGGRRLLLLLLLLLLGDREFGESDIRVQDGKAFSCPRCRGAGAELRV